jgi:hypothetical protein
LIDCGIRRTEPGATKQVLDDLFALPPPWLTRRFLCSWGKRRAPPSNRMSFKAFRETPELDSKEVAEVKQVRILSGRSQNQRSFRIRENPNNSSPFIGSSEYCLNSMRAASHATLAPWRP